jgi:hypothetical protein
MRYKGITKDALEMYGIYIDDNGQLDYKRIEKYKEMKAKTKYRSGVKVERDRFLNYF